MKTLLTDGIQQLKIRFFFLVKYRKKKKIVKKQKYFVEKNLYLSLSNLKKKKNDMQKQFDPAR